MRSKHSYAIAASLTVAAIALPATLYHLNQRPKFHGIIASGTTEQRLPVVTAPNPEKARKFIGEAEVPRNNGGAVIERDGNPVSDSDIAAASAVAPPAPPQQVAGIITELAKNAAPAKSVQHSQTLPTGPAAPALMNSDGESLVFVDPHIFDRDKSAEKSRDRFAAAPAAPVASAMRAPAAKAKLAASPPELSDLQEKGAALEATTLHKGGSRREGQTSDAIKVQADAIGTAPQGWIFTKTGQGTPKWTIEADPTAPSKGPVLKQSGKATYPLALKAGAASRDGFVEVKFKAIAGTEDRAAGLVWRTKDANNYYVVRANALEDNVVLYKTVAGRRVELDIVGRKGGYGLNVPVPSGQWHTLRVEFSGQRSKVIYNGKALYEVDDATFMEAGMVGLWTKADSVTAFDAFTFGPK